MNLYVLEYMKRYFLIKLFTNRIFISIIKIMLKIYIKNLNKNNCKYTGSCKNVLEIYCRISYQEYVKSNTEKRTKKLILMKIFQDCI